MQTKNVKLIDVFPDYYIGDGIFDALRTIDSDGDFPWLTFSGVLDIEYIGNHSGEKTVGPLIDKFIKMNRDAEQENPYTLTTAQKTSLANILKVKYGNKWKRLYAVEQAEYEPIENYRMEELETPDITRKHSVSDDYSATDTRRTERDISRSETPSDDYKITDTRTIDRDITRTEEATDDYIKTNERKTQTDFDVVTTTNTDASTYGFNSNSPVPTSEASGDSTVHTIGDANNNVVTDNETQTGGTVTRETADAADNVETSEHTQTGGITVRETASANSNVEEITKTQTGYTQSTETGTRALTRSGNIGVTTSQQMLESEIALWQWNFIESVYTDIDTILTIQIYD